MSTDRTGPYSITDELAFIKALGQHTTKRQEHQIAVMEYYQALRGRVNWDNLDRDRVMKACNRELVG